MKKLLLILIIPVCLSAQEVGTWFPFSIGDPAFDFFFSLVVSAGLPVFLVVAVTTALMSRK